MRVTMHGALYTMVLLLLAAACERPASTGAKAPVPTVPAQPKLRAEPLAEVGVQVHRYRVAGLPNGHGYEPGRLLGLFGRVKGLAGTQPVGAAEVVETQAQSLELVALWVDPDYAGAALEVGEVPTGHHFGSKLGQVLVGERDPRQVRINMGASHGVTLGNVYAVLGDAYTDANAGGRSLGRRQVGEVQVVEVDPAGQTAVVELRQGEAPSGAFVRYAGHAALQPRPVVKVLVTRFQGDIGDAYGQGLRDALERAVKQLGTPDIRIETTDKVVDTVDASDAQATRLGRDSKVDVVVWGSASRVGKNLVVRPRVTFIDARQHGERLWDPVKMDAERVYRAEPDAVSRRVQGLASYLAGLMYYTDFEGTVAGSYGRAAGYFQAAIDHGDQIDADNARFWLFFCLERIGDWAGAEGAARTIEREGKTRKDDRRRALGLIMRTRLAATTGALDRALDHAREAARLFDKLGDISGRAGAMGEIAGVYHRRGELEEALRIRTQEEIPIYDKLGDAHSRAVTMGKIADIYHRRGDLDEALRIRIQEQIPVFDKLGDIRERAAAMGRIADIYYDRGELDEALRIRTQEQLPVDDKLGDIHSRAFTMGKIADIYYDRGELDEALRIRTQEQLPIYEKLGDIRERAVTMGRIADIYQRRGALDEALRIRKQEELPIYDKVGDIRSRALAMSKIANVYYLRGELDEALRICTQEVLPVYDKMGDIRSRAMAMGYIANIYSHRGELDEALRIYTQDMLPVLDKVGDIRGRAATMGDIADIYYRRGELDEALRIRTEEQLPVYDKVGDIRARAVTMGKIADIYHRRGQLDEALRIHTQEELPVYDKLGDTRSRAITMGKIADIYERRGELDEAVRIRKQEVLPVYDKLGARKDVLVCQAKVAIALMKRNKPGDRKEATTLLRQALRSASTMKLPEANIIKGLLKKFGIEEPA